MSRAIVGIDNGAVVFNPDAATLAAWALAAHVEACPQCRRGDELCPAGDAYEAATRPDRAWVPPPRTGA